MQQWGAESEAFHALILEFISLNSTPNSPTDKIRVLTAEAQQISKQPYFMQVAFNLLSSRNYTKDQLTLLTNFLKNKFMQDFDIIDLAALPQIMARLRGIVSHLGKVSAPTLVNLSLCLAYIYIHLATKIGPVINYLSQCLPEGSDPNYYFKILELVPDQVKKSTVIMDDHTREQSRVYIGSQQQAVLVQLNNYAPKYWDDPKIHRDYLIGSFGSWVDGTTYSQQILNSLPDHFIFQTAVRCILDGIEVEECCICLTAVIRKIVKAEECQKLMQYLGHQIFGILPKIELMIRDCEFNDVEYWIEVMCEFGEKSIELFVSGYDDNIHLYLSTLVRYGSNDNLECFETLLDFWEDFLNQAIRKKEQQAVLNPLIYTLFAELYKSFCYNCQYPWALFSQLDTISQHKLSATNHQVEVIIDKRNESKYIYEKISTLIGKPQFLQLAISNMVSLNKDDPSVFWPKLESFINSIARPLKKFPTVTDQLLKIVNSFEELNPPHTLLRRSYIRLFRSLMSIEVKQELFIKNLFGIVVRFIAEPLLMDAVDKAFCEGCQENSAIISMNVAELLPLMRIYPNRRRIIQGFTLVLNSSPILVKQYLPQLLQLQWTLLQSVQISKRKSYDSIFTILQTIGAEKDTTPYQVIVQNFTRNFWPTLKIMLTQPLQIKEDEDQGVEQCVKLLKILMRCLKIGFAQFLPDMLGSALEAYRKYPISSYIYLLEVAITVYYEFPAYTSSFKELFISFCQVTYTYLDSPDKFEKYMFVVEDFIGMCKRFFIYNASIVMDSGQLPRILHTCINVCVGSNTPKVAKASYSFFETIFMVYWPQHLLAAVEGETIKINLAHHAMHQQLRAYLLEQLPFVLTKMLEHLSRSPIEVTAEYILDALLSEVKAFSGENQRIWVDLLQKIPASILVRTEKQKICQSLVLVGSENISVSVQATATISRLLYLIKKRLTNEARRSSPII